MSEESPPALRNDLKMRKITQRGETFYILKEPEKGAYFRFDEPQYLMMTLFDGQRSKEQLIDAFDKASDEYAYDMEALDELLNSARDNTLLERSRKERNAALMEKLKSDRKGMRLQRQGSLLHMRFKLVDPNALFDRIIDKLRWIWSPWGVRATFVLMALAILVVVSQGDRFINDLERVFFQSQSGLWGFMGVWIVALGAIALHEVGHGLTCKHYGGDVDEMGFLLLAFNPCLYCNVNDAWLFEENRHKIYVALAGVWFEMILGAFAAFIWVLVDSDNPVGMICFILMCISTASSLFMNLNPLMKFDGYYILADMLEVPNLRENAISWFSYSLKTKIFRLEAEAPLHPSPREKRVYLTYGGLTVTYLTLMLSGLAVMVYGMVADGMGTFPAILFLFLILKVARLLLGTWPGTFKELIVKFFFSSVKRKIVSGVLFGCFVAALFLYKPPISIVTEGAVDAEMVSIHASEGGFVTQVGYQDDRSLTYGPGGVLFVIQSPDMALEKSQLIAQRAGLDLDQMGAHAIRDPRTLRHSMIQSRTVEEKLASINARMKRLEMTVPDGDWLVYGPPPVIMEGRHVGPGEEVLKLMPRRKRGISVLLEQADLSLVEEGNRAVVQLTGVGERVFHGVVQGVTPVAKAEGPKRLFQVRVALEIPEQVDPPPVELTGRVKILGDPQPLWKHIVRPIRQMFRADLWI
ncbi:MAG: HlyD family efflux transporter periplasmic adaptor subunit [Magnetococcales bacterium]|nr:HlyD family efflux transporter periplasmic adaptor subunit [Magnetococcales bacterium]